MPAQEIFPSFLMRQGAPGRYASLGRRHPNIATYPPRKPVAYTWFVRAFGSKNFAFLLHHSIGLFASSYLKKYIARVECLWSFWPLPCTPRIKPDVPTPACLCVIVVDDLAGKGVSLIDRVPVWDTHRNRNRKRKRKWKQAQYARPPFSLSCVNQDLCHYKPARPTTYAAVGFETEKVCEWTWCK